MMLELGDDGVVSAVNEDDLIYVDKNELDELVDRYNRLKEENEQLKERNKKRLQRLKNQRKELEKQQDAIWGYKGDIKQLKEKNEELKHHVKEAYLSERTQLGKSVLKQLLESIGVEI